MLDSASVELLEEAALGALPYLYRIGVGNGKDQTPETDAYE